MLGTQVCPSAGWVTKASVSGPEVSFDLQPAWNRQRNLNTKLAPASLTVSMRQPNLSKQQVRIDIHPATSNLPEDLLPWERNRSKPHAVR